MSLVYDCNKDVVWNRWRRWWTSSRTELRNFNFLKYCEWKPLYVLYVISISMNDFLIAIIPKYELWIFANYVIYDSTLYKYFGSIWVTDIDMLSVNHIGFYVRYDFYVHAYEALWFLEMKRYDFGIKYLNIWVWLHVSHVA